MKTGGESSAYSARFSPESGEKLDETIPEKKTDRFPLDEKERDSVVSGIQQHDGFFLRIQYGFGKGRVVEEEYYGDDREFDGTAGVLRVQIGYEVGDNLMLFGALGGFSMQDPDVKWQGTTVNEANADLVVVDLGIGLTYYIMPYNLYFSGSLNTSATSIDVKDQPEESGSGYGIYLSVGKEWWVSDNWGLGVALFVYYGEADVENESTKKEYPVQNRFFGIAFSATYN